MGHKLIFSLSFLLLAACLESCSPKSENSGYLLKVCNTVSGDCGYCNPEGDTIIPPGKYSICFTDTFKAYAIVGMPERGFVAIDRNEHVLYGVYPFDNGPDYPSEGLFRIIGNHKIGFADAITGKVIIKPQFGCAWPFENGYAKVSIKCSTRSDGEHTTWLSDNWFFIDKKGKKANLPKVTDE